MYLYRMTATIDGDPEKVQRAMTSGTLSDDDAPKTEEERVQRMGSIGFAVMTRAERVIYEYSTDGGQKWNLLGELSREEMKIILKHWISATEDKALDAEML